MARYRGQKALYEVISTTKTRPVVPNQVHRPEPQQEVPVQEPVQTQEQVPPPSGLPTSAVRWHRFRFIQFNQGKVELTIPYPIAIAIVLAFVLIVLAAFRLGQYSV
ncbi:MAG: hypothetical protein QHH07_03835 [Sedimentisphaerales bacterium]|jgi:hypothetical protein|nr:hypothetical protein [Sedimentisphaerales bacterium]